MLKSADSLTQTETQTNPLSFEECFSPHYQELLNYARRLAGGDAQRAHDVVQDSMIRAMRAWHRFVPDEEAGSVHHAVRGWLYRIVCNTYMRAYRAARRRPDVIGHSQVLITDGDRDLGGSWRRDGDILGPDPRDATDEATGDEVLEAVARLAPAHRQVIEMHYLKEMTVTAIAAELGIPRNTVFTRLHRARLVMKKYLAEYAEENYGFIDEIEPLRGAGKAELESTEVLQTDARRVDRVVAADDASALLVA